MQTNQMNDFLKPLEVIQQVEVPPFLLTRLNQKIRNEASNLLSPIRAWAMVLSFCLLLIINFYTIKQAIYQNNADSNLSQSMHLMPQNDFYK